MMRLRQFFVDDTNALSCMRLMCVLVDVVVLGVWAASNVVAMCNGAPYVPLGYAEAGLVGMAHGCKAAQGKFEYGGPGPFAGRSV